MFSKTNRLGVVQTKVTVGSPRQAAAGRKADMPSIVSAGLQVEGTLRSAGDIQIDGRVIGDVICRSVTIAEDAQVQGQVLCETARIDGYLSGEVRAKTVQISKSAKITGDVVHETLAIEAGAHIEGRLRRANGEEAERLPPPDDREWSEAEETLVELKDLKD